jgi:hypothetical protein
MLAVAVTARCNQRSNGAKGHWDRNRNRSWPMAATQSRVGASPGSVRCGLLVDFYGSWQDSWKPTEHDAQGRSVEFLASPFPYDAQRDCFTCPAGKILTHHALLNRGHGVHTHVYRAPKTACRNCPVRSTERATRVDAVHHAHLRACDYDGIQGREGDRSGTTDLPRSPAPRAQSRSARPVRPAPASAVDAGCAGPSVVYYENHYL